MAGDNKKPLVGGAAVVILALIGLLADITQIVSIGREPLYVVILIALGVVIVWSAAMLIGMRNQPRRGSFWLALWCLMIAGVLLSAMMGAGVMHLAKGSFAQSNALDGPRTGEPSFTSEPNLPTNSNTAQPATPQTPETSAPVASSKIPEATRLKLWLSQGAELDANPPKVLNSTTASSDFDLYLAYYGLLEASSGLHSFEGQPQGCVGTVASGRSVPSFISPMANKRFCFTTSEGKVVWMQIIRADVGNFDPSQRHVEVAVRVWSP